MAREKPHTVRTCVHCGDRFVVNPRLGVRHRYCRKPDCVRASRRQAQRKWRRSAKGHDYFRGAANVLHVRAWRRVHPDYAKRRHRVLNCLHPKLAAVLRELALQDSIDSFALLLGLVADRTNLPLQDSIARELRRLILVGHGLLKQTADSPRGATRRPRRR
jgi:hypothetical protein